MRSITPVDPKLVFTLSPTLNFGTGLHDCARLASWCAMTAAAADSQRFCDVSEVFWKYAEKAICLGVFVFILVSGWVFFMVFFVWLD